MGARATRGRSGPAGHDRVREPGERPSTIAAVFFRGGRIRGFGSRWTGAVSFAGAVGQQVDLGAGGAQCDGLLLEIDLGALRVGMGEGADEQQSHRGR